MFCWFSKIQFRSNGWFPFFNIRTPPWIVIRIWNWTCATYAWYMHFACFLGGFLPCIVSISFCWGFIVLLDLWKGPIITSWLCIVSYSLYKYNLDNVSTITSCWLSCGLPTLWEPTTCSFCGHACWFCENCWGWDCIWNVCWFCCEHWVVLGGTTCVWFVDLWLYSCWT